MKNKCEMIENCNESVTMVDKNGFLYCCSHGKQRKLYMTTRKLTKKEIFKLKENKNAN